MSQTDDLRARLPGAAPPAASLPPTGSDPRKPPWRRRWAQVTGGILAALIAVIAVVSVTNHLGAVAPKPAPRPSATAPVQTPQQKFLTWYHATGQHDVLTLTRDTSMDTADENSGDTAVLQHDGTTLRNDSIAAIAHPNPRRSGYMARWERERAAAG